jgi:hypothetical protein
VRHAALFLEHRFALDQFLHTVRFEKGVYDFIVFGRISRPMNVSTALGGVAFELLQIPIEVSERVLLILEAISRSSSHSGNTLVQDRKISLN